MKTSLLICLLVPTQVLAFGSNVQDLNCFIEALLSTWNHGNVIVTGMPDDWFDDLQFSVLLQDQSWISVVPNPEDLHQNNIFGSVILALDMSQDALEDVKVQGILEEVPIFLLNPGNLQIDILPLRVDTQLFYLDEESSLLREIYKIKNDLLINQTVGSFVSETCSLKVAVPGFYDRRADLKGITLVETVLNDNPVFNIVTSSLQDLLNFTITPWSNESVEFGVQLENGEWTGMIGSLLNGSSDFCANGLTITPDRSEAIDFTTPILEQPMTLSMQAPSGKRRLNYWAYTTSFLIPSWIAVLGMTLILAVAITLLDTLGQGQVHDNTKDPSILQSLAVVVSSLVLLPHPLNMSKLSVKIMIMVMYLYGFLIFTYYTGVMTSTMTVLEPPVTIKSLWDVFKYDIDVVTLADSSIEAEFLNAKEGTALHAIYERKIKGNEDKYFAVGFPALQELTADPNTAIFGPSLTFMIHGKQVDALDLNDAYASYVSIGLPKNSEFTRLFNYGVTKVIEHGLLLNQEWRRDKELKSQRKLESPEALELNFDNILFVFIVLALGIGLALALISIELLISTRAHSLHTK